MKCVNQSKKFKEIKAWKISPLNFIMSPLTYYTHTNLQTYSPIYPSILSSQWLEPLDIYIIHLISVFKDRKLYQYSFSVHRWMTVQWKVAIHGKPNVPKIQKRSTSDSRNGCALVPDRSSCHQKYF